MCGNQFGSSFDVWGAYGIILGLRGIGFRVLVGAWRGQPVSIWVQPGAAWSNLGTSLARVGLGSAQLGGFLASTRQMAPKSMTPSHTAILQNSL